jgi:hypothetical protein
MLAYRQTGRKEGGQAGKKEIKQTGKKKHACW